MTRVVLASTNPGKAKEFNHVLGQLVDLKLVSEFVGAWEVEETGHTFYANALHKAETAANVTGLPSLADDSGLSVYYLGGQPGVRSARFAGPLSSDQENNELLQQQMRRAGNRTQAHFTCVLCLKVPGQPARFSTGRIFGNILTAPRGEGGFGYDPLFEAYNNKRTLAEMSTAEKNAISHRGLALRAMVDIFRELGLGK